MADITQITERNSIKFSSDSTAADFVDAEALQQASNLLRPSRRSS
jgi:hypothetical protein